MKAVLRTPFRLKLRLRAIGPFPDFAFSQISNLKFEIDRSTEQPTNRYSFSTPRVFLISFTGRPFQNSARLSIEVKERVRMRSIYSAPFR